MQTVFSSAARKATNALMCAILLVFPLFTGTSGYSDITRWKFIFIAVAVSVWFAAAAVLCIRYKTLPHMSAPAALCAAFALWAAVSAFASPWFPQTLLGASRYTGLVTVLIYALIFIAAALFGVQRRVYIYMIAASCAVCCLVASAQLLGCGVLYPNGYDYYDGGVRYVGTFLGTIGNTNLLAAFLAIAVPVCWLSASFGMRASAALAASGALGTFVLCASGSAGGLLAVAVSAAVAAPLLAGRGKLPRFLRVIAVSAAATALSAPWMGRAALLGLAAAAALMAAAALFGRLVPQRRTAVMTVVLEMIAVIAMLAVIYFFPPADGHLAELSSILHGEIRGEFGSSRLMIWQQALALVPERPLLGGGPGTLSLRLDVEFSRYFPELEQTLTTYTDNAHNVYISYLVDLGLPGLALYLALIAVSIAAALKRRSVQSLIILSAMTAAWTESFFGLGLCLTAPVMWAVWGLLFAREETTYDFGVETNGQEKAAKTDIRRPCDNGAGDLSARTLGNEAHCQSDSVANTGAGDDSTGSNSNSDAYPDPDA